MGSPEDLTLKLIKATYIISDILLTCFSHYPDCTYS